MSTIYRGAWVVAYRELLRFLQDRARIVSSLTFPLLFLGIFGAGFGNVVGATADGVDLLQFMYPGIIAQSVVLTALVGGVSVVTDREEGFVREILVAPLSRAGIVLGKAAGAAAVAMLQALTLLAVAPVVGVGVWLDTVVALVPTVVLLSLALSGLGILIASLMRSPQGFQTLINALVFPLVFLAGVFFPVDSVPWWMQLLSKVNPVTYGVDAIRQIFPGWEPAGAGLGVTVLGHTMSLAEDLGLMTALGLGLLTGAAVAFGRRE
jgi:ABC-2 type transport system permease protein